MANENIYKLGQWSFLPKVKNALTKQNEKETGEKAELYTPIDTFSVLDNKTIQYNFSPNETYAVQMQIENLGSEEIKNIFNLKCYLTDEEGFDKQQVACLNNLNENSSIVFMVQAIKDFTKLEFEWTEWKLNEAKEWVLKPIKIEFKIMNVKLFQLKNILKENGVGYIARLGVQGTPGTFLNINGENIHIGKTGRYEMPTDQAISSFGVYIPEADDSSFVILDYQYREGQKGGN